MRESFGQVLAGNADPEHRGWDRLHQLGRQSVIHGIERRVASGGAAQGIEPRREMSVRAVGGDQRHAGGDGPQ